MKSVIAVFGCIMFIACQRQEYLSEKDLFDFIQDESNGLIAIKRENGFILRMMWRPSDLIALQQASNGGTREFDSLKNYFSNYLYFTLDMSYGNTDLETQFAKDPSSFADKMSFLNSELSENIRLITKSDSYIPLECLYTRSYGTAHSQCLIVFPRPEADRLNIELSAPPLGIGKLTFSFLSSDILSAPKLKIK